MNTQVIPPPRASRWGRAFHSLIFLLALSQANAADDFQAHQAVREFLTRPPIYDSLLLRRTLASGPVAFRNRRDARRHLARLAQGGLRNPAVTSLFEVRHQSEPPAFVLRALLAETDFESPDAPRLEPFVGRHDTHWWILRAVTPGQVQFLESADGRELTAAGVTNTYCWEHERWATEFLRLGLFDVLLPTLEWSPEGHSFQARTEAGGSCMVRVGDGAHPGEALLHVKDAAGRTTAEVTVEFVRSTHRWIPRKLSIDHVEDAAPLRGSEPYATLEALQWRLSDVVLPRERFSPEPYLRTNDLWLESVHGEFYLLEDSGTGVVRTLLRRGGPAWSLQRIARYLYGLALLFGGIAVAWHYLSGGRAHREAPPPLQPPQP